MTGPRLGHAALWVRDLERMQYFYTAVLGGTSGAVYENLQTGFRSCFIRFAEGPAVELMYQDSHGQAPPSAAGLGYAHIGLSAGSRSAVDETVARLRSLGVKVVDVPRLTGDGFYEAVIEDPEGNRIELVE